ncbi:LacI family DNA-binding transcriptional regulator [Cryobacterium sp. PH31-L1]|uniref:LacI family DNA-binding transcriptional regulator n=1 Tax=Cryobacterium sp. PH31-L1 TaxID=3046199 RepID=UPI0024BBEA32|nr:LacI family DNA-binding transcriptional regulator [Cryobacterium sp. PH31-L1]MDJ0378765.1 LacI family DNA-binding transcriptional regulator [Cryobacterium sp. PH31-L1]
MATIHDVAKYAGVSAGTVSNVLNRPGYVAPQTRDRVLAAIAHLGFTPIQRARKYPAGRQRTLGLALADLVNPFFVDVALGAEAEAKSLGVGVVIVHNGDDVAREQDNLDLLVQQRVHGIMIAPVRALAATVERLDARDIPLVYVDRVNEETERCWVKTDDVAGGRLAGEHLIELGHRNVAFVGNFASSLQANRRFDGFAATLAEVDVLPERVPTDSWRITDGRMAGAALAARATAELPTAIMCGNDLTALGVLLEFAHRGIRVPDDVSIVGFDDLSWSEAATVPLTTVRQPREEMGRQAVRLLLDEIDRGEAHAHHHELLVPELVARASSAAPRPMRSDN